MSLLRFLLAASLLSSSALAQGLLGQGPTSPASPAEPPTRGILGGLRDLGRRAGASLESSGAALAALRGLLAGIPDATRRTRAVGELLEVSVWIPPHASATFAENLRDADLPAGGPLAALPRAALAAALETYLPGYCLQLVARFQLGGTSAGPSLRAAGLLVGFEDSEEVPGLTEGILLVRLTHRALEEAVATLAPPGSRGETRPVPGRPRRVAEVHVARSAFRVAPEAGVLLARTTVASAAPSGLLPRARRRMSGVEGRGTTLLRPGAGSTGEPVLDIEVRGTYRAWGNRAVEALANARVQVPRDALAEVRGLEGRPGIGVVTATRNRWIAASGARARHELDATARLDLAPLRRAGLELTRWVLDRTWAGVDLALPRPGAPDRGSPRRVLPSGGAEGSGGRGDTRIPHAADPAGPAG